MNIGGDYEIGQSVRRCVSVCLSVYANTQPARMVATSCENVYIGGDMHSDERLRVFLAVQRLQDSEAYLFSHYLLKLY